ncbi:hypothetical protein Efla_003799 [Eimeria flavescens]
MMLDTAGGLEASNASMDDFYADGGVVTQQVFTGPGTHGADFSSPGADSQRAAAGEPGSTSIPDPGAPSRSTVSLSNVTDHLPSMAGATGTLDGQKVPGGAKFAVSQLHGVYLALNRLVLSRCAPWGEFTAAAAFQRPGTGAATVDRMERNLRYFSTNYLCICCALGLVCALLNPVVFVIAASCGALCAFAAVKGEVQVGSWRPHGWGLPRGRDERTEEDLPGRRLRGRRMSAAAAGGQRADVSHVLLRHHCGGACGPSQRRLIRGHRQQAGTPTAGLRSLSSRSRSPSAVTPAAAAAERAAIAAWSRPAPAELIAIGQQRGPLASPLRLLCAAGRPS